MHRLTTQLLAALGLCGLLIVITIPFGAVAQSIDAVADLAARINRERIAHGLVPFALNPLLTAAAQSHATDLARTGKYRSADEGHLGSDGSTIFDRIARTGYGAFSWGRRLGENWAHYNDTARAFSEWMDSTPHRNNILHALYREIGIGVAKAADGGFIYIINFGAQPNVLPFFINDNSTEARSKDVTLTFSDELVAPSGDGANIIGHPIEMQISNVADFVGNKWQPYTARINWTLPSGAGTKTVYVKYRDAKGRTATASDSILLNIPVMPSATATPTLTQSPTPTRTLTSSPRPTATETATASPTPTDTPRPTATETATASATPTDTPTQLLAATSTSIPTVTTTPIIIPGTPTAKLNLQSANSLEGSSIMGGLGFAVVAAILLAVLKSNGTRN